MSFFKELKRRNVVRVGIAYAVTTWLLIQVTDIVFPRIGLPDSAVTLVIALLGIGFIPALILAWAFEMTPDGIKLEKDVDREKSITPQTGKRLDRMIIAGLAIIIIAMGVERYWFAGQDDTESTALASNPESRAEPSVSPPPPEISEDQVGEAASNRQSVAVLPFDAMSSGEDDGYFADGLTEEILNSLARLPELLVTARTSSFHFKNKNLPIPEIAKTLGVAHVVEGSVRRSGERVRITAQLIRAEDGFHLWSNTYDRTLEDVFAVQEDIAASIAETLDVVLNDDKRKAMRRAGIGNVEAFIAYQKGMELMAQAHSLSDPLDLLPEANQYFDQALAIVPTITDAQLERTDLFGHIIYNNATGISEFTLAELEAALAEIQTGLSQAARFAQSEAQRAYLEAERAEFSDNWSSIPSRLDLAFNSEECFAVNWVSSLAAVFGWSSQVTTFYKQLMRCDPVSGIYVALGGQFSIWAGQAEQAIEFTSNYLQTVGFNPWVDDTHFFALLASGRYRNHPGIYDSNPEGSYFQLPRSILVHAMNNETTKAREREIFELSQKESTADDTMLLLVEASLGNREAANAHASKMDSRFAGPFILAEAVKTCLCGAPFDLEATPNFKARIEEAGFNWPPPSPINFPAKDW
jgi:TolB-like protein